KVYKKKMENTKQENDNKIKFSIDSVNYKNNSWTVNLQIHNINLIFKVDTGADVNIMSLQTFNKLGLSLSIIKKCMNKLYDYNGNLIPTIGKCIITSKFQNNDYEIEYFIVKGYNHRNILGLSTSERLGLINCINFVNLNNHYQTLLAKYSLVFEGIGMLGKPHSIELKENAQPVSHPIRKVQFAIEEQFKQYLKHLEDNKIIEKVHGSTDWLNSFVIVKKSDGSLRICLDPKDLNRAIKKQKFKIPKLI
ncbi:hypothetical protein, partial [Enterobacter cloacae complex sp. 2DZ2F20B]|uniref:hypothetical protein n=1 Tax=Enterobacter cloacae complex sp. 2DZ2F20B TaxID=2511993 RepID=UPI001028675B